VLYVSMLVAIYMLCMLCMLYKLQHDAQYSMLPVLLFAKRLYRSHVAAKHT
jgi:hypothetical protein